MSIPRTVAQILREHVTLEVEGIDRMYLNVYVPALQRAGGVASFFRFHRGHRFASSALMDPITKAFIAQMEQFAEQEQVPIVAFKKASAKMTWPPSIGRSSPPGRRVILAERRRALLSVLVLFSFQLRGFTNQEMRALLAQLLGLDPAHYSVGRMTYDLRRLRLHGLLQRIPHSHRYEVTPTGLRIALFFTRTYARLLRPKLAQIMPIGPPGDSTLRAAFDRLQTEIDRCCREEKLAASNLTHLNYNLLGKDSSDLGFRIDMYKLACPLLLSRRRKATGNCHLSTAFARKNRRTYSS